jgi:hypothetical protein
MIVSTKEKTYPVSYSLLWSTFFFVVLIVIFILSQLEFFNFDVVANIESLTGFEFVVLALATQRLTRLFVYDGVFQFVRDCTLDLNEVQENGQTKIQRCRPKTGFKRLCYELLACPWCASIWLALIVVSGYFLFPFLQILWLILAFSSLASIMQITTNLLGWQAEKAKNHVLKES